MGRRGPAPKRADKRHGHRAKADLASITPVQMLAAEQPALGFDIDPIVADWYAALADGPEAEFYSPATWQRARIVAHMLHGVVTSGRPSSTMYAALQQDMRALLVDAAELRRLGIDVQPRAPATAASNVIDWRARATEAQEP